MGKMRIVECRRCGKKFETTARSVKNVKWCPDCRKIEERQSHAINQRDRAERKKLSRVLEAQRSSREQRLKARDEEYAALGVPVTTRVLPNGRVVETRGQARISSSCGIAPGMDSAIARKYL